MKVGAFILKERRESERKGNIKEKDEKYGSYWQIAREEKKGQKYHIDFGL